MIEFTVISPSADAVKTTLVNGTRAADAGTNASAGCAPAETVNPDPDGTVVVVPPVVPVVPPVVPPVIEPANAARDFAPKYPAVGVTP